VRHRSGQLKLLRIGAALLLAVGPWLGCSGPAAGDAPPDPDTALRDTLGISLDVDLHRVALGGERDRERIFPDSVLAREGDVVAFETVDGRVHELDFAVDSLTPDQLDFLRASRQLESPPLLSLGTRFLVDLTDAPDGRYVFRARTVGEPVYGVVRVGETPGG